MLNKIILITGGTGSWGHELIKQLLEKSPKEIRVFQEMKRFSLKSRQQFINDHRLKFIIGDIRDKDQLVYACQGVHYVFHLAL